ncbi:hypothetical protein OUZ56_002257 [Daphnia magna]|uniref:Nucleolus and neural progenitor protein-like N-terminal domain-containing protein n=1 Tax=Daphnia magna TaxID=35525 RepID=A0ABR0A537_9CRUS|nr:hypothetical protein OUZ56_002257 [Daphnia magna]
MIKERKKKNNISPSLSLSAVHYAYSAQSEGGQIPCLFLILAPTTFFRLGQGFVRVSSLLTGKTWLTLRESVKKAKLPLELVCRASIFRSMQNDTVLQQIIRSLFRNLEATEAGLSKRGFIGECSSATLFHKMEELYNILISALLTLIVKFSTKLFYNQNFPVLLRTEWVFQCLMKQFHLAKTPEFVHLQVLCMEALYFTASYLKFQIEVTNWLKSTASICHVLYHVVCNWNILEKVASNCQKGLAVCRRYYHRLRTGGIPVCLSPATSLAKMISLLCASFQNPRSTGPVLRLRHLQESQYSENRQDVHPS